ncbi:toll/interleukin-1 receptor domain-containing protein [Barnesiella viscericola]|uniref:toll/interleukin-1 receptor domain-containing protein n=1 Tax=Barnesiella viscericola TaxID=397865 RepID=UPI0025A4AB0E|nr:toll/interleukin-1 receptor domain-containing protein [Barnesiella viscericola]MDM8269825.1 toll/interleukin-1 receptor domain-containing protein [Barnesiella viscericola]
MRNKMEPYKFFVFISYRHTDIKAARWLQLLLETYSFPVAIRQRKPDLPKRIKVFRDKDELTSGILDEEIQKKLDESKYLVVICSPEAVKSKYVGDEIAYFRSKGRERQIIPFIIKGKPNSAEVCYHPELKKCGELLGIEVREEESAFHAIRFHKAFIRLVGRLLDLDFGELWNRRRHLLIKLSSAAVLVLAAIGVLLFKTVRARPFDVSVQLQDAYSHLSLSQTHTDSLYLYLGDEDVRSTVVLDTDSAVDFRNIPGKFKDEPVKMSFRAYGFEPLDTVIRLGQSVDLPLVRDSSTYGHIRYQIRSNATDTPLSGVTIDFGFAQVTTDEQGVLDVQIPLEHQQAYYPVVISRGGEEYHLTYPYRGGDCLAAIESESLQIIYIQQ